MVIMFYATKKFDFSTVALEVVHHVPCTTYHVSLQHTASRDTLDIRMENLVLSVS